MGLREPPLSGWLEALVQQRFRRARALAGWRAGARAAVDLERLASRAPELGNPEPVLAAQEALARASTSDQPALRRAVLGFAEELGEVASAAPRTRWLAAHVKASVSVELEVLALADARCELAVCRDRVRRAALARGVEAALGGLAEHRAEAVERALSTAAQLGLADEKAWGALAGVDVAALAAEAEVLLRDTADAARDLLEYRLRRSGLDPQGGTRAELELALELLDLREHFSPHLAPTVAQQLALGLQLDPRSIAMDVDPRPHRVPGMEVAQLGSTEFIVVSAALRSPADLDRLAHGLGNALHRAHAGGDPLLDAALPRTTGEIFARPLADPAWARRVLRLPARPAQELAQAFALRGLMSLRVACARLLVAREVQAHGPSPSLVDHHRSQLYSAMFVDWTASDAYGADLAHAVASLRAHALAEQLGHALLEGFDADWWRNPHSQELLRAFWTGGPGVLGDALPASKRAARAIERAAR